MQYDKNGLLLSDWSAGMAQIVLSAVCRVHQFDFGPQQCNQRFASLRRCGAAEFFSMAHFSACDRAASVHTERSTTDIISDGRLLTSRPISEIAHIILFYDHNSR